MPYSNKACTAPKQVGCGKRGHRFKLDGHMVHKCLGNCCRYLVLLDQIDPWFLPLVRTTKR